MKGKKETREEEMMENQGKGREGKDKEEKNGRGRKGMKERRK